MKSRLDIVATKKEIVLLELYNHKDNPLKIWLEPWCEELELPKGVSWRLTAVSADQPTSMVTIKFHEDQIVIYGVPDAVMRIYAEGELIWECFEPFPLWSITPADRHT